MQTIFAFIIALGILIFIHEMGHYLAARWCGVKVLRFSVGFGKPLLRFVSRGRDQTEWTVGAIPLGGYVRMLDERELDEVGQHVDPADLPRAFNRQSVWKRFAIVAAGPAANFLLAIVLYMMLAMSGTREPVAILDAPPAESAAALAGIVGGERIVALRVDDDSEVIRSWNSFRMRMFELGLDGAEPVLELRAPDGRTRTVALPEVPDVGRNPGGDPLAALGLQLQGGPVTVTEIVPDSAASRAGLMVGDRIVALDGAPAGNAASLIAAIRSKPGQSVTIGVERAGQAHQLQTLLGADAASGTPVGKLGAGLAQAVPMEEVSYGLQDAMARSLGQVWSTSVMSLRLLGKMLVGEASLQNLSGPLTVASYAGKAADLGIQPFIQFLALISISLGVLNLLPIPVLDGGHLLYYCVEILTGRPIPEHWQMALQKVGMACILLLTSLALFNDFSRLLQT
ncbi:RIP metalloprotease RseP [Imbroritus primus]|uniref:RIP metalloprotease RseP n=1 Tax=Imbroritus primus TaxID=3058603 RepID=UPI003D161D2C